MSRLAAIDTGTNSTRLLIADTGAAGLREVVRETTVTRLGEGVDQCGRLVPAARKRVYECVGRYAAVVGELGASRVLIVATSSVRDAADGESFLAELGGSFGFDHKVLTGDEEAALAFTGALSGGDQDKETLLFDVGGGSTEVVAGRRQRVDFSVSMNVGCVRLRERLLPSDPAGATEMRAARQFIDGELARRVPPAAVAGAEQTLAVAGTVTTLAALDMGLESYDRELVHGHRLSHDRVKDLMERLGEMTVAEKMNLPLMEPGRADVIVAGALIVERLLSYCGQAEMTVSEHDILDGIALAIAGGRL